MNEYHVPLFMTGSLPKRDPNDMWTFIICLSRMNIEIPKDILKMIYERMSLVKLRTSIIHVGTSKLTKIQMLGDFLVITAHVKTLIYISRKEFELPEDATYLFYTGRSKYIIGITSMFATLNYWEFIDNQYPLKDAIGRLSTCMNYQINGSRVSYNGNSIGIFNGVNIFGLTWPQWQEDVSICMKHELLTFDDPISEEGKYAQNEVGKLLTKKAIL